MLESLKDQQHYVEYSSNLKKRFEEHNKRYVSITKHRRPSKLIYVEGYLNQQDATSREKFFKTGWGRTHLKKVLKNYMHA